MVRKNHLTTAESIRSAVDEALKLSFESCDDPLDLDEELFEPPMKVAWDQDKYPDWLQGHSVREKSEVGVAMAKVGAQSNASWQMSY